jgi:hypothetical protein
MVAWRARIGLIKPTHRGKSFAYCVQSRARRRRDRADVHWLSQREAGKLS